MTTYRSPRKDAPDLQKFGPRLPIEVGLPIVKTPNQPGESPSGSQEIKGGLIDTGAARTVLIPKEVNRLRLPLVDHRTLCRVGGTEVVGVHVASVRFPNTNLTTIEIMQVLCCELPQQPVDCLIGRDILSRWLFTYDGKLGAWAIDEETRAPWIEPESEGLWR